MEDSGAQWPEHCGPLVFSTKPLNDVGYSVYSAPYEGQHRDSATQGHWPYGTLENQSSPQGFFHAINEVYSVDARQTIGWATAPSSLDHGCSGGIDQQTSILPTRVQWSANPVYSCLVQQHDGSRPQENQPIERVVSLHGQHFNPYGRLDHWEGSGERVSIATNSQMPSPPRSTTLSYGSASPEDIVSPQENALLRSGFPVSAERPQPTSINPISCGAVPRQQPENHSLPSLQGDSRMKNKHPRFQEQARKQCLNSPTNESGPLEPREQSGNAHRVKSLADVSSKPSHYKKPAQNSMAKGTSEGVRVLEIVPRPKDSESKISGQAREPKSAGRRKRVLTDEDRRAVADTRKIGACIRCRMQRLKCEVDTENRDGPCLTCAKVDLSSSKVIHRQPCIRTKLADVVLYNVNYAGINTKLCLPAKIIDIENWFDEAEHDIQLVTRGLCSVPMNIRVRKFDKDSMSVDQINYFWMNEANGEVEETKLEPYALASVSSSREQLEAYIEANAVKGWEEQAYRGDTDQLISKHYKAALEYYNDCDQHPIDRRLLLNLFKFCFAQRIMNRPSWIYSKDPKSQNCLGMSPAKDEFHPLIDRIPTPPTTTSQIRSLAHVRLIKHHEYILEDLEKLCCKKIRTSFFTVYLVTFIMLHELAATTEHYRRSPFLCAAKEKEDKQESYRQYLEVAKKSANILLLHWQYYRRAPESHCAADDFLGDHVARWFWTGLEDRHEGFCRQTWRDMKKVTDDGHCNNHMSPGNPFYWISQMFDSDWSPKSIWDRVDNIVAKQEPPAEPAFKPRKATKLR
ncbi:hypothetical protein HER10_EVM0012394 [Colletotrichum scovillei]|uniref:Tetratricopeptide repeat domain containing protein n=1 Tax=Colletotrichum scovillei TaxID=1209932 RepID=A0A9P7U5Q2_9PEZI|nr:uncharacterized protein HER10_EVM0012394 [Colletotrichum scovillei]KAF4786001.1 hypothetical protein HER10_EVM0012394 [Colletotrichum scovillei]KAG7038113.1 Tetratricopeptide repeat domain containing protein [Colletotrichum scovillei]KAG7040453.1 Tetratricopeptide repeat domain containing protein [Colletotrichum scovillei]KAG7060501.1 Tetratricopeptide repeat domain containing protein [Colletotrichum scovillei]